MIPPPFGGVLGGRKSQLSLMGLGGKPGLHDLILSTPDLVSFYPCDEASATPVIRDIVGGYDLTFDSGSTAYLNVTSVAAGPEGAALQFPNAGPLALPGGTPLSGWRGQQDITAHALYLASTPHSLTTYTVEYWFAPSEFGDPSGTMETAPGIFQTYDARFYPLFSFGAYSNGGSNAELFGGQADAGLVNQGNFSQQRYKYLTTTWDGTTLKRYTNGVLKLSGAGPEPTVADVLQMGSCGGQLYGFAVYSRALSATEIGGRFELTDPSVLTSGRVTQLFAETLRSGNRKGRLSQYFVEVLCDIPREDISVSAASGLSFTTTCSDIIGITHSVSATQEITLGATSSDTIPALVSVSATNEITLAGSGGAVDHAPTPFSVSASSRVSFSGSALLRDAQHIVVSAATTISLHGVGFHPVSWSVSAINHFFAFGQGDGPNNHIPVSALSGLVFSTPAVLRANLQRFVSASTVVTMSGPGIDTNIGPRPVSSTSLVTFSQVATLSAIGPRLVSAATNLSLSQAATFARLAILNVSASSGVILSSAATESGDFSVTSASSLAVASTSKQNRGLAVGATTGLGMGIAPITRNLKPVDATSTATFSVSADQVITGTDALAGLVFTDLARAVVWIPWRRSGLTLPPGGNLPHS